jgi:hypothetical protein
MARTLDQILATEKPAVVANAQVKADAILLNIYLAKLRKQQENQSTTLRTTVEAGEQSGESDLSLHDIAAQVKQQHCV